MKYYALLLLFCLTSCIGNKHYAKSKHGFDHYYFVKQHREDNLRLLIFTEGIPHYSYTKIYANKNGEISRVVIERDGEEFYEAVTTIRNEKAYFKDQEIQHVGLLALVDLTATYMQHMKYAVEHRYCADLKSQPVIGFIRVARPKDYLVHLGHKKFIATNYHMR